ncbi:hypothetical protein ACIHIX_24960 [Streptomyces sp. NPDC051913]|uniref:aromatic-ring hydroxylase C-terminal domain-containing protein n=1 Tax=Streptomyces sp. NPDC051913 TaxID=3365676 RepID=UPI0037D83B1D
MVADVLADPGAAADMPRERRGLLRDLVGPAAARDTEAAWTGRVHAITARTSRADIDALLIRPDGVVARALRTGRDLGATAPLNTWFGQPV